MFCCARKTFNKIRLIRPLIRSVHITSTTYGIGTTMKKVMAHTKPKKKRFFEERPILPNTTSYGKDLITSKSKGTKRRVNVLNKLFMRHITDLMATGEMSSTYSGLGLEINKVEVTPDYNGINVFWIARSDPKEGDIAEMLATTAKRLRYELTQLRVIGNVPKINFVKDKQYAEIIEIDNRLAKADFGEDHEPLEVFQRIKTQLMINTTLPPNVKDQIQEFEKNFPDEVENDVPDMPQDVLGLNHKNIMDRIKKSMKSNLKSKMEDPDALLIKSVNTQPVEYKSAKLQREAFQQFLMERQILKRKLRRANLKQTSDLDYEDEYLESGEEDLDCLQTVVDDKDYIEEDVEDYRLYEK